MPCYCDVPDENDQAEIERRAKIRMYFDAQELMTEDEVKKCIESKIGQFPIGEPNERLCALCKNLSKDTMSKVSAYQWNIKWPHKTLYDWYVQHLKDDRID